MIKIKICGITREEEIADLNKLNPDYIGFVFAESRRKIEWKRAQTLSSSLNSNIKRAGVFKDMPIECILKILRNVDLDVIQLHGNENIKFIEKLKSNSPSSVEVWKSLSIYDEDLIGKFISYNNIAENILIDGAVPGSGKSYSLEKLKKLKGRYFLAGGITPENIADKLKVVHPYGIDVSSGVEILNEENLKRKSFEKMKLLIDKVRNY